MFKLNIKRYHGSKVVFKIYKKVYLDLQQNGLNIKKYNYRIRDNITLVSIAVKKTPWALFYASRRLQNNSNLIRMALKKDGRIIEIIETKLKYDLRLVKSAYFQDSCELFKDY